MALRIMVSRHSAFYSPLIAAIAGGFLERAGLEATYSILGPGQRSHDLIREGVADVMQSAVSSNWKAMAQGISPLPVHFAQVNRRDGFFLCAREQVSGFEWKQLEGRTLLADHGLQPLAMLKYAVHVNGVDWGRIHVVDSGSPEEMSAAFAAGSGDYLHRQGPGAGAVVVSVGASMPKVAFSSLCCSREFLKTETFEAFLGAFMKSREWVREADPWEIADKESAFFPGVDTALLADSIRRYQGLGCWAGDVGIPRELYEQALNVFEYAGEIQTRPGYEEVVAEV